MLRRFLVRRRFEEAVLFEKKNKKTFSSTL